MFRNRPGTRRRAQLAGPWASVGGVDVLVVQGPGQRGDPAAALTPQPSGIASQLRHRLSDCEVM